MNHGGELLLTLLPWVTALLVAIALYDDYDFPQPGLNHFWLYNSG